MKSEYNCNQLNDALVEIPCHFRSDGTVKFLTKGDNNSVDDRGLYAPGQLWLTKKISLEELGVSCHTSA